MHLLFRFVLKLCLCSKPSASIVAHVKPYVVCLPKQVLCVRLYSAVLVLSWLSVIVMARCQYTVSQSVHVCVCMWHLVGDHGDAHRPSDEAG